MKKCFKCGKKKQMDQFYKHPRMVDGHLNKCKACTKKDVSVNYRVNRDYYAEYERLRFKDPKRKAMVATYARSRRERRPGRYRCQYIVSNAIRDGRLIKQPCEKCGASAQAHHDDYRKPLEVRWLCRKHHLEHHGKVAF